MLAWAAEPTPTDCVYDTSPLVIKLPISLPPVKQPGQACTMRPCGWLWLVPRPSCKPLNLSKDAPTKGPRRTTEDHGPSQHVLNSRGGKFNYGSNFFQY